MTNIPDFFGNASENAIIFRGFLERAGGIAIA